MRVNVCARSGWTSLRPVRRGAPLARKIRRDSGSFSSLERSSSSERIIVVGMGNPLYASLIAGATRSVHLRRPYRDCASSNPRTVPGTPDARHPSTESSVGFPEASRYMSRDARAGACSRKSMNVERPLANRISMNPPPPRLPAKGCVTARANPTATAASTALPPRFKTDTPTSVACGSSVTTMAWGALTGSAAETGEASNVAMENQTASGSSAARLAMCIIDDCTSKLSR